MQFKLATLLPFVLAGSAYAATILEKRDSTSIESTTINAGDLSKGSASAEGGAKKITPLLQPAVSKPGPLGVDYTPTEPSYIVCTGQACSGTCEYIPFSELLANTCYAPAFGYLSAEVFTPGGFGLPYGVYAALAGCADPVQLPVVNTCYNLFFNGIATDFSTFYIT